MSTGPPGHFCIRHRLFLEGEVWVPLTPLAARLFGPAPPEPSSAETPGEARIASQEACFNVAMALAYEGQARLGAEGAGGWASIQDVQAGLLAFEQRVGQAEMRRFAAEMDKAESESSTASHSQAPPPAPREPPCMTPPQVSRQRIRRQRSGSLGRVEVPDGLVGMRAPIFAKNWVVKRGKQLRVEDGAFPAVLLDAQRVPADVDITLRKAGFDEGQHDVVLFFEQMAKRVSSMCPCVLVGP
jgi:hypothetical protein